MRDDDDDDDDETMEFETREVREDRMNSFTRSGIKQHSALLDV